MTDPDAVALVLARLARGDAGHRERGVDDRNAERVVADAEAAMEQLDDAAAFVDGREAELRRAVRSAEAAGDDRVASRGRTVLTTLSRLRTAAGGDPPERPPSNRRTTSTTLAQRSSRDGA